MTTPIDTEDWKLGAWIDFKPTKQPTRCECTRCHGGGILGGGFKSMDDPYDCPDCLGRGTVTVYPYLAPKPEVPKELIEHLRKAFYDYFKT